MILNKLWNEIQAAEEICPLPAGLYRCRLLWGGLAKSRQGTPCYRLTFEILDGEFAARRLWHNVWLTEAALPFAKRDLAKLGITNLEQLDQPVPQGVLCNVRISLRVDNQNNEFNRVRSFLVIGTEGPDPFRPEESCTVSE